MIAKDKRSSLLQQSADDREEEFSMIETWSFRTTVIPRPLRSRRIR